MEEMIEESITTDTPSNIRAIERFIFTLEMFDILKNIKLVGQERFNLQMPFTYQKKARIFTLFTLDELVSIQVVNLYKIMQPSTIFLKWRIFGYHFIRIFKR